MKAQDIARFWSKVEKSDECWEWAAYKQQNGYGQFGIGRRHVVYAHRVAAYIAGLIDTLNPMGAGNQVCHTCDNRGCVNPAHLFIGTAKDNAHDRIQKGRCNTPRGENAGASKLLEKDILIIRRRHSAGELQKDLAKEYKVHSAHVSKIVSGKKWAHI
jgi:hypothetical protein